MTEKLNLRYVLRISLIAALGGLLFGYDWVVIGGAKPFYERFFEITGNANLQGWAMSSALIGCIFGALIAGALTDKYGRKKILIVASFLFVISAIGTGLASEFWLFISYRILGGLGIGMASTVSPMYISEVSPQTHRGRFVSLNQLTIVIGILCAQIINYLIAEPVTADTSDIGILQSWNGQMGWRWMFWAEIVPAIAFFVTVFFIPESTRWLVKNGDIEPARKILNRIGGNEYANTQIKSILCTLEGESGKVRLKMLISPGIRKILLLGIFLAFFQQWCGINVIFNYAEEVFTSAGFTITDTLFNIVLTGSVNLIFTFVAIRTVDRWGRRKLMLLGAFGLGIIYIFLGACYYLNLSGIVVLTLVIMAIACYAMTLAPITWVILSEIFPNRVRGTAMSVSTL